MSEELVIRSAEGLSDAALSVDRERSVIRGATIMQRGPLNPGDRRPWFVDDESLRQLVTFGNASPKGLKARWTHPQKGRDGLGSYVGRWRKIRLSEDGERVIGDIHLARVAFHGGEASLGNWLLTAAEEDPESFGVSITPLLDFESMASLETDEGLLPLRFLNVVSADFVEEPAAVSGGLFGGSSFSSEAAACALSVALDCLIEGDDGDAAKSQAASLLSKYLASRFDGAVPQSEEKKMAEPATKTNESPAVTVEQFAVVVDSVKQLTDKIAALSASQPPADKPQDEMSKALAEDRKRATELQALAENAGLPNASEAAREWITKGFSLTEAKASLFDSRLANNPLTNDPGNEPSDTDTKLRREYQEQAEAYRSMGVTEDEYLSSRKSELARV